MSILKTVSRSESMKIY